jgi:heptosyltransferase-2
MTLPAIRAVRARFPEAHLAVLARPWVAGLYARESAINETIEEGTSWRARLLVARALRRRSFDAVILLTNSFATALTARASGIPRRIGYDRHGRRLLLTEAIAPPKAVPHETIYYLELLRRAGIVDSVEDPRPVLLDRVAEARAEGERLLGLLGISTPVLGVSPGAQNSRAKQWPPQRFVEAAAAVASARGWTVVVFGSAGERPLCAGVAAELRRRGVPVMSVAGETTLEGFVNLAAACRVFLTNDSGAMHVASALGVPTVAVFGPTDFRATAPAGPRARIVREPADCAPCLLRDCPTDHRCMLGVTPERVARAAIELVDN